MKYVQFTEFRNKSKAYFDDVEDGHSYTIIRRGKPVAQLLPVKKALPGWKRKIEKITLHKKIKTIDLISQERNAE